MLINKVAKRIYTASRLIGATNLDRINKFHVPAKQINYVGTLAAPKSLIKSFCEYKKLSHVEILMLFEQFYAIKSAV